MNLFMKQERKEREDVSEIYMNFWAVLEKADPDFSPGYTAMG